MNKAVYIHGTEESEQDRLAKLNDLTNDAFLRFVEVTPKDIVLDIGSGLGLLARRVSQFVPEGQVYGVERSEDQLARVKADRPNLHFRQADAHALPFADNTFDVVYCRYVLEHVSDPVTVLREMRRVLKPAGRAFLQENNLLANTLYPDCPHFDRIWQCLVTLQNRLGGDALIGKRLLPLLIESGFMQIELSVAPEVHYFGTPSFEPWIENFIGNIRSCENEIVSHGLATDEEIQNAIDDLRTLITTDGGSAFFYWNRAKAVK